MRNKVVKQMLMFGIAFMLAVSNSTMCLASNVPITQVTENVNSEVLNTMRDNFIETDSNAARNLLILTYCLGKTQEEVLQFIDFSQAEQACDNNGDIFTFENCDINYFNDGASLKGTETWHFDDSDKLSFIDISFEHVSDVTSLDTAETLEKIFGKYTESNNRDTGIVQYYWDKLPDINVTQIYNYNGKDKSRDDGIVALNVNLAYKAKPADAEIPTESTSVGDDKEVNASNITEERNAESINETPLTKDDFIIQTEKPVEEYVKYNNNMMEALDGMGDSSCIYFLEDDEDEIEDNTGEVIFSRNIALGESTKDDLLKSYGAGLENKFNPNTDLAFSGENYSPEHRDAMKRIEKTLVSSITYNYKNLYQIIFFIDNENIIKTVYFLNDIFYTAGKDDISHTQTMLNERGYNCGNPDGVIGKNTEV